MRDYKLASPSLEGLLRHGKLSYGGIDRPDEILNVMDGPATRGVKEPRNTAKLDENQHHIIEQYFHDLYGVFMKKLSHFIVNADPDSEATLTLQAMLQEMIKVKSLMSRHTVDQ